MKRLDAYDGLHFDNPEAPPDASWVTFDTVKDFDPRGLLTYAVLVCLICVLAVVL